MAIRLLRAADRAAVPWKNGGGITREVAVFPPGAGMADFGWRVSIADIAAAGPFSRFDGIDRILTVLQGRLQLAVAGQPQAILLGPGEQLAFAGDVAVTGTPIGTVVRDLNVMVRRGSWSARIEPYRPGHATGAIRLAVATRNAGDVEPMDVLMLDPGDAAPRDFAGHLITLGRG